MRIVYGVSGEGLGHVFEAQEVAARLREDGHVLKILTYGDRACEELSKLHPTRIEGLPLHFGPEGLSLWRTMAANRHVPGFFVRNWARLKAELQDFAPDLFLTAYEPYTTLMSHVLRRPLVSMDNQNAVRFLREIPPGHRAASVVVRLATACCTWGAYRYLIKSYQPVATRSERDRFVAPLVQRSICALHPTDGNPLLVYLTKPNHALLEVLTELGAPAWVYCGDRTGEAGPLVFRRRGPSFLKDLASCRAIVGTAGFSLIADALYLGKPYFAVPLRKQFEQTINGLFLARSGFGASAENPSVQELRRFLDELPVYRRRIACHRFDPNEQVEALRTVLREIAAAPNARAAAAPFSAAPTGTRSCTPEKG